jgi:predicted permease
MARTLVVAQVAVSLVLLVVGGLFVRSLLNLEAIATGFDPRGVLLFRAMPPVDTQPMTAAGKREVYRALLTRAERVPGVERASASSSSVFGRDSWGNVIAVDGFVPPAGVIPRTFATAVTSGYFAVMRIDILRGRGFTDGDHDAGSPVAIANETFVRRFLGAADPIGRHVGFCSSEPCGTPKAMMTIVGIVEDAKYGDLREAERPMLYVPSAQAEQDLREVQVRTAGEPAAVAAALHRALAGFDPRLAIVGMIEARDHVDASVLPERLMTRLSVAFAVLALGLATVGLYGLVAYATIQRRPEIGIRVALGAGRGDVRRLVLGDTARVLATGMLVGIPLALASARVVAGQLYDVTPDDPLTLGISVVTLAATALVAASLPARAATRIDPSVALRAE